MTQVTPRQTHAMHEHEADEDNPLGPGMTTAPRGNGPSEPGERERGEEMLERVLGW